MAVATVLLGMALPLLRNLYEQPFFLWVSLVSVFAAGAFAVRAPIRARTPLRRKLFFLGLAASIVASQIVHLYHDHGSPSLWEGSPETLVFFRELVHIVEYGFLAAAATWLLQFEIGRPALTITGLAYAFTVGIADETVQWLHAFRVGDIRDVVLNGLSACAGLAYQASFWSARPAPSQVRRTTARWLVLAFLAPSPLLFTEFYLRTQTGHLICDDNSNCFSSHFTEGSLESLARERLDRWAGLSPGSLTAENETPVLWRLEDYFLTEARAHLRLANDGVNRFDLQSACVEMKILNTYYRPSLPGLGVRPEALSCPADGDVAGGVRSRAFGHLDTAAHPGRWRAVAAAVALALAGVGAVISQRRIHR